MPNTLVVNPAAASVVLRQQGGLILCLFTWRWALRFIGVPEDYVLAQMPIPTLAAMICRAIHQVDGLFDVVVVDDRDRVIDTIRLDDMKSLIIRL